MELVDFTPYSALLGGVMIGLASCLLLWTTGRVAGISGVVGGLWQAVAGDRAWRLVFLGGLVAGGIVAALATPDRLAFTLDRSLPMMAIGGLLVGLGTRIGNGCTSGHGVCGIARFSPRSIVATITFIAAGVVTVFALKTFGGVA